MLRQREQEELRRQQEGGFKPNFMDNVSKFYLTKVKFENTLYFFIFSLSYQAALLLTLFPSLFHHSHEWNGTNLAM